MEGTVLTEFQLVVLYEVTFSAVVKSLQAFSFPIQPKSDSLANTLQSA